MSTIDPAAYAALQRELNQAHAYPAAIELDNARLIRETQQALEQQTTTAAILRIVSQSITDSQPVMEAIVASCHQLFPTDSAGIWLADDDEHGSLVAFRGPAYAGLETVPKRTPTPTRFRFPMARASSCITPISISPPTPRRLSTPGTKLSAPMPR